MKLSDRDKKIIVIILIALVVALPYLLLIKPTNEKSVVLDGEIATLQERFNYLDGLNQQREFYLSEIDRYDSERDGIIEGYAEGIRQENIVMFLRGIELDTPVAMSTVSFSGTAVTPVLPGATDENGNVTGAINALKTQTSVAYSTEYEEIKTFLKGILDNDDRMVVSSIDMTYDAATGRINGMFVLDQFAITGDGRELPAAVIPAVEHGNESIFGTYISDEALREALEEGEEEAEEAEEE